ncbi:hypothetical protein GPU89_15885 [Burkholderia cepacia]|nr:hypothetical protein [Burkholderia cepacia]
MTAVRFDVLPPLPSIHTAGSSDIFPHRQAGRDVFHPAATRACALRNSRRLAIARVAIPRKRVRVILPSFSHAMRSRCRVPATAHACDLRSGIDKRINHISEIMRAAKCRGKTFVFMSQSFARKIVLIESPVNFLFVENDLILALSSDNDGGYGQCFVLFEDDLPEPMPARVRGEVVVIDRKYP